MAVLHLQFDIDGEVHPELHDMLAAIASSRSRAERLCQLAATGLLWERLRLQAYGRVEVPALDGEAAPAVRAGAMASAPPAEPAGQAGAPVAAPALPSADDYVDLSDAVVLAHLADPEPADRRTDDRPLHDRESPGAMATADAQHDAAESTPTLVLPAAAEPLPLHELRSAVQSLPVLTEVVAATELPDMSAIAAANETTSAALPTNGASPPSGAQIHELAPVRKSATRARLLRMKEMGLFKNE